MTAQLPDKRIAGNSASLPGSRRAHHPSFSAYLRHSRSQPPLFNFRPACLRIAPSGTELNAYIRDQHVEFPVLALPADGKIVMGLGATPSTFLVNTKGVIEQEWIGAYVDSARLEIEGYFNVSLPHLASDAQRRTAVPAWATPSGR